MIVPQDNKNANKQQIGSAQHSGESMVQPPPPYRDVPSQPAGPSPSQPFLHHHYSGHSAPLPQNVERHSAAGRFCKAFLFACLIWLVFSMFVHSIVRMASHSYHGRPGDIDYYPLPDNVKTGSCHSWSDELHGSIPPMHNGYPYASFVSYELPISASKFLFLSRGRLAAGRVKIVTSPEQTDKVLVDVGVFYRDEYILDSLRACRISNKEGTEGVAIITPKTWHDSHPPRLQFEMTIYLPEVDKQPLTIDSFRTDMGLFAHDVADLDGKVYFKSIDLKTSNMPISVQSLSAEHAVARSSNGPITGTYHTDKSLELRTSNSPIKIDLGLHNDGKGKHTTEAILHTSNGQIVTDIGLHNSHSKSGGNYSIIAHTSNAPFKLDFTTAPINSALKLKADTSNSPGSASMHATYQGRFTLTSSTMRPSVQQGRTPDDPEDKDRKRSVEYSTVGRNTIVGSVRWDEKHKVLGSVDLKTSNSPVVLHL